MRRIIVSIHDVHQGSLEKVRRQVTWLERLGVKKTTLYAVPDYHGQGVMLRDSDCAAFLREMVENGHEVALHGYHHLRMYSENDLKRGLCHTFWTRYYTANEAEFLDLSVERSSQLLRRGRDVLGECGLFPVGFVAPAWLLSDEALLSVWEEGFSWTCLVGELLSRDGGFVKSRSLCWSTRTSWRIPVSLIWNQLLGAAVSQRDLIRLSLHPDDLEFREVNHQVESLLWGFLEKGYKPISYGGYVRENLEMINPSTLGS